MADKIEYEVKIEYIGNPAIFEVPADKFETIDGFLVVSEKGRHVISINLTQIKAYWMSEVIPIIIQSIEPEGFGLETERVGLEVEGFVPHIGPSTTRMKG